MYYDVAMLDNLHDIGIENVGANLAVNPATGLIEVPLHFLLTMSDGKPIKHIYNAAELMLCNAINLYLIHIIDKRCRLKLQGVKIDNELVNQPLYNFMRYQEFSIIFGANAATPTMLQSAAMRGAGLYASSYYPEAILGHDTEGNYTFDFGTGDVYNRNSPVQKNSAYAYICLFARVIVGNFINKTNYKFKILRTKFGLTDDAYAGIITLLKWNNKLGVNRVEVDYVDTGNPNQDYEWLAHCWERQQVGLMTGQDPFPAELKMKWFQKNNFKVGDVVILIKRKPTKQESNVAKNRQACYPAVITSLDTKGISLKYLTCIETKLTQTKRVDRAMASNNTIYKSADKTSFSVTPHTFTWQEIGVDGYASREYWLIFPPVYDDYTQQYLRKGNSDYLVTLNTIETMYAVLKDRGIKFNEDRYRARYFRNAVPIYDQYTNYKET